VYPVRLDEPVCLRLWFGHSPGGSGGGADDRVWHRSHRKGSSTKPEGLPGPPGVAWFHGDCRGLRVQWAPFLDSLRPARPGLPSPGPSGPAHAATRVHDSEAVASWNGFQAGGIPGGKGSKPDQTAYGSPSSRGRRSAFLDRDFKPSRCLLLARTIRRTQASLVGTRSMSYSRRARGDASAPGPQEVQRRRKPKGPGAHDASGATRTATTLERSRF
jgi:hypothetical protein